MTAVDPRRAAWAYLSQVVQGPCAPLNELVEAVGIEEAARAVRERDLPPVLQRRTEARRHIDTSTRDLELVARRGGRLVTPDDAEWPAWRMLGFAGIDVTRDKDGAAPLALWVLGEGSVTELTERAVAVVGTRAASSYGSTVTAEIVGELATQGFAIVSGGAFGIDGAAHRAALAVGGVSIAVLACGIERAYPTSHEKLLHTVASTGLVVSEYGPGVTPAKYKFLARNRLVAALSDAVLVVEAGWRSGARNTVKWGRRLGRPTLAVPGSVHSVASTGCHQMIRDGEARLVTRASEVIDEAGPLRLPVSGVEDGGRASDALVGDQLLVYEALPARGSRGPRELSEASGVPIDGVRGVLPLLELSGLIGSDETGWFRVRKRNR
ncbi:DNA-processing protein DprA [Antrihabitans cavernicola]|uniref:DNA-protecting protein DprA n=1 Tax=Antrihabitans cavernicola TaxID=2495913 RepID=A0A5A7SF04_9NOCA|nr:DNA-processing protein DprA [Spelaeibacter cavernicola]KAA0023223.1 DNA-protecting protein DprA [Spelaeibacter cavernicola]